jgi:hypothetical protein
MNSPSRSPAACTRYCPAWGSAPCAQAADAMSRPATDQPARRAGGIPRTPRHPPGWPCRCPARRCSGAPRPTPPQDVFAVDLVSQRMEPSFRVGPGRPVQRMLQRSDSVPPDSRQGGPSRNTGTHQSAAPSSRANEAAALPITAGCVVLRLDRYYDRLRLPPGTPPASRLLTGYRAALVRGHRGPLRTGRASPVPAATI